MMLQEGHPTCVNLTPIPHTDGHLWRKYGEKKIKNSPFPRTLTHAKRVCISGSSRRKTSVEYQLEMGDGTITKPIIMALVLHIRLIIRRVVILFHLPLKVSWLTRLYYRCSYRDDRNCVATKVVQQENDADPPLYRVTYIHHHTCSPPPPAPPPGDVVFADPPWPGKADQPVFFRFSPTGADPPSSPAHHQQWQHAAAAGGAPGPSAVATRSSGGGGPGAAPRDGRRREVAGGHPLRPAAHAADVDVPRRRRWAQTDEVVGATAVGDDGRRVGHVLGVRFGLVAIRFG
uniref:WRKY domain-containing protein n=1 Tax=Oryza brachyantha TaxID=4533 RepID=J3N1S0_ORYBR